MGGCPPSWMIIHLGCTLPCTSSSQPGRHSGEREPHGSKPCTPPLFGLAPGGVCRAACVTAAAVRSYRTLSPLPDRQAWPAVCFLWHFPWSRLRRTLSGTVSPWSPDFPHRAPVPEGTVAPARSSSRLMSDTDIAPINGNCIHVWPCLVTILPCQMSTVRRTVRNVRNAKHED